MLGDVTLVKTCDQEQTETEREVQVAEEGIRVSLCVSSVCSRVAELLCV